VIGLSEEEERIMTKVRFLIAMLACFIASFGAGRVVAQDPDPERIYAECLRELRSLTERCVNANHAVARECIPRIRELLAAGHEEEAHRLAARCIGQINEQTEHCVRAINALCERCVHALRELEAFELAERFAHHCQAAVRIVQESRARAVQAIRSLFD
jgi:hypothetical protein